MENVAKDKTRTVYKACRNIILVLIPSEVLLFYVKEWVWLFIGGLFLVLALIMTITYGKLLEGNIPHYRPGKGFWFYRLSPRGKRIRLTVSQCIMLLTIIVCWVLEYQIWYATAASVAGIYYVQFTLKRRIKQHTAMDGHSLLELEQRGLINLDEMVVGFYQDSTSWSRAPYDSKVFVITTDRLKMVRLKTSSEVEQYEIRLNDIMGLHIFNSGKYSGEKVITMKLVDGIILHLYLVGGSYQGSPEQFISSLLKALDQVKLNSGAMPEVSGKIMVSRSTDSSASDGSARSATPR
ncbi:hypothetical protein ACFQ3W_15065 [Paenibacillus puldeungensis]|uniref:Uncharacterized protein n=1 Tax=Paenibacillus puldeungensis TaxID=696536 RepID=A0ABW3RYH8_9BACL